MNKQSILTIPSSPLDDTIAHLKLLKCTGIPHRALIDDEAAICLQNLEALQAEADRRLDILLTIRSSDNLHWIARAFISAISNKHHTLSVQIERLLALFVDNHVAEICEDPTLQKKAFARIKQLNELAESTLRLEQQFAPVLQEMNQIELNQTHPCLYQNSALNTQFSRSWNPVNLTH